jgi:diguanylate cyclase (GGDEF)-like protein
MLKPLQMLKPMKLVLLFFFELLNSIDQIKINIIKNINSTVRDSGEKLGRSSIQHNKQINIKDSELERTRSLLNKTTQLKRYIDEQKSELELINRELERKNRELYRLTIIDDLTHLYSYNHFESLLKSEFKRSSKYSISFSLLVIDIDNFKFFNDNHGHFTGDRLLKERAGILSSIISPEDVIGRIGGDSVPVILPHQSIDKAIALGLKLVKACNESSFKLNGINTLLTVTAGASDNLINNPKSGLEVLNNAIDALKKGKADGKNCLRVLEKNNNKYKD